MRRHQENLETAIGQVRATARYYADSPRGEILLDIERRLVALRDPEVIEQVERRAVERASRKAAAKAARATA